MQCDTQGISFCFDEESASMLKDYRKNGLSKTAKTILSALTSYGLAGKTVLELGCGFGALTVALLRAGAASAVGIDLSPKMVETANSLAFDAGFSKEASYRVGDGAKESLAASDVVVLDTVLCCYPDLRALLDNSSSAATRYYAISIPDDRRPLTRLLKALLPLQPLFRRGTFRFFVHPTRTVVRMLEDKGFKVVHDSTAGWVWSVLVFAAPAAS